MATVDTPEPRQYSFMEPLVAAWCEKITLAYKAKDDFADIAEQCNAFFSQASGFMWKPKFKSKFLGNIDAPKFEITINKAFELVALFGPSLYWQYPQRRVTSVEPMEWGDDLLQDEVVTGALSQEFGVGEPEQISEFLRGKQASETASYKMRAQILERYLNFSQREVPGGGLATHSELAITEALVKGRGCLWSETYSHPGSNRVLTGMFYDSVDNLLIDPDCEDPTLRDAQWIARRHTQPVWVVERKFNLKPGSLRQWAQYETAHSQATRTSSLENVKRKNGQTYDLVTWYEIWSKGGVGNRLDTLDPEMVGVDRELSVRFDEVVGDYAYCCVVKGCPFFLNATSRQIADSVDEDVASMFEWRAPNYGQPFPCYADDRWPVCCLDFYRTHGTPWPIAPLAPALGELIALNILASALVEQGYDNRKQIIGVLGSAADSVKAAVKSKTSPAYIEIQDNAYKSIREVVQYLDRPEMNRDIITAIDYVSNLFDKRTGLTEFMYAMNVGGAQSRSARDVAAKEARASVRPDKMAKDVSKWQEDAAELEKFLASWVIEPGDVVAWLGEFASVMWRVLITEENPEYYIYGTRCLVGANDTRKPNKELEAANLNQLVAFTFPMLQQYAMTTGDSTPINEFMKSLGRSMEQEVSGWQLGDWKPPEPSPEEQQMAQQAQQQAMQMQAQSQQLEMQKLQAEVQKTQVESQTKLADSQMKQQSDQIAIQKAQADAQLKQQQELQKLTGMAQQEALKLDANSQQYQQELAFERDKFMQSLMHDKTQHATDIMQKRQENLLKLNQMRREGDVKLSAAQRQARSKAAAPNGTAKQSK